MNWTPEVIVSVVTPPPVCGRLTATVVITPGLVEAQGVVGMGPWVEFVTWALTAEHPTRNNISALRRIILRNFQKVPFSLISYERNKEQLHKLINRQKTESISL